jgi:hypothetical protein
MLDDAEQHVKEPAVPETVEPPKGRGWYVLAGFTLAVALGYAASGWLIDPTVGAIPYWLYVLYSQTALYVGMVLIGLAIGLVVLWVILAMRETVRTRIPALAGLIILLAGAVGLASLFPSLGQRLYHRDTSMIADRLYFLAFQQTLDNNNTFILYQCDRLGVLCTLRYASRVYPLQGDEGPFSLSAQLVPSVTPNSLAVVIEGEIIHTHEARFSP